MTNEELEQIYNEAYRAVYWTAMSLLKSEADAEDIVQDTFVAFIESYSDIKDNARKHSQTYGRLLLVSYIPFLGYIPFSRFFASTTQLISRRLASANTTVPIRNT